MSLIIKQDSKRLINRHRCWLQNCEEASRLNKGLKINDGNSDAPTMKTLVHGRGLGLREKDERRSHDEE